MSVHDWIGSVGALLIVGSYLGLQVGRLDPQAVPYSLLNAIGAALIIWSLLFAPNTSAFIVEGFWLAVSLFGLLRARSRRIEAAVEGDAPGEGER